MANDDLQLDESDYSDIIERPAFDDKLQKLLNDPDGDHGIRETVELIDAVEALALALIREVKDGGIGAMDVVKILLDGDLRRTILDGLNGSEKITVEAADLSREERRALMHRVVDMAHNIEDELTA